MATKRAKPDAAPVMTIEEARTQFGDSIFDGEKRNKYGAKRTWSELCQWEFASRAEAARGEELALRERAKEIRGLEYQPSYKLSEDPPVTYVADFAYWVGAKLHVEDVKGRDTPASRIKRAWLKQRYGIIVTIWFEGRS